MKNKVPHPHNFKTKTNSSALPYTEAGSVTLRYCQHCKVPQNEENSNQSCSRLVELARIHAQNNVKKLKPPRSRRTRYLPSSFVR